MGCDWLFFVMCVRSKSLTVFILGHSFHTLKNRCLGKFKRCSRFWASLATTMAWRAQKMWHVSGTLVLMRPDAESWWVHFFIFNFPCWFLSVANHYFPKLYISKIHAYSIVLLFLCLSVSASSENVRFAWKGENLLHGTCAKWWDWWYDITLAMGTLTTLTGLSSINQVLDWTDISQQPVYTLLMYLAFDGAAQCSESSEIS